MKVRTFYGEYEVLLQSARYMNGNLAIQLFDKEDGCPFAFLTTNLDILLAENWAFVDTNNCPWAENFLIEYDLGKPTGYCIPSGFCTYPIWEVDIDKLKQCETM